MIRFIVALLVAGTLFGQEPAFERLKQEAARAKASNSEKDAYENPAGRVAPLHLAFRDWIESRLPSVQAAPAAIQNLEVTLQAELKDAGMIEPDSDAIEGPGPGYIGFEFKWLPELPESLFVIAHASVDCGSDDVVYMYRFDSSGRTRAFEDHPKGTWGHTDAQLELSEPDSQGRRLLLTHYQSAQCQSTWMAMAYVVNRVGLQRDANELLLSDEHGFWLGNDGPDFVLKPDELIIQFLDSSIDPGIHNRTQIHRYSFVQGVQSIDPVSLQPQDFAEEWLTRPWHEMQSRSAEETSEWHDRLAGGSLSADYAGVVPCPARPGRWVIALDFTRIGEKLLIDAPTTYFLVNDLGEYHYKMEAVSSSVPAGCSGPGLVTDGVPASVNHPTLTKAEMKALP